MVDIPLQDIITTHTDAPLGSRRGVSPHDSSPTPAGQRIGFT